MIKRILALCFLLAALALSSGCICSSPTTEPGDPLDRAIQGKVIEALGEYTNTVSASTVNGRVYLSGWVSTKEDKNNAVSAAEGAEGVKEVLDDIQIKAGGRSVTWK